MHLLDNIGSEKIGWGLHAGLRVFLSSIDADTYPEIQADTLKKQQLAAAKAAADGAEKDHLQQSQTQGQVDEDAMTEEKRACTHAQDVAAAASAAAAGFFKVSLNDAAAAFVTNCCLFSYL